MSVLGVDLGTTGVRAVAFDTTGAVVAAASHAVTLVRPGPGLVEQDPGEVISAAESVIRRAAADSVARGDRPQAMAFAVHGEAVLPLGADGAPLARIPVSMDTRGEDSARALGELVDPEWYGSTTGQPLHGMFSAFKIAAGRAGWREAAAYRCVGDFLTERWTGQAVIDSTSAARVGLYDVEAQAWSEKILSEVAGIAPWVRPEALPRAIAGGEVAGELTADAAARLGLSAGLPVVAGAHDQAAAFLGAGGAAGGASVIGFGSSDCISVGSVVRPRSLHGTGFATYKVDSSNWVTLAGTAAGGWSLDWFARTIGRPVEEVFDDLATVPPSLLALPYLAGLDTDPAARGLFFGLSLETSVPQMARALVESAGFEFAKILDALRRVGLEPGPLHVTGSGAQNSAALAVRASAADHALTPVLKDASARGAAILAARGAGIHAPGLVAVPLPAGPTQRPDPLSRRWYQAQRSRYGALYASTRKLAIPSFMNDPIQGEEE